MITRAWQTRFYWPGIIRLAIAAGTLVAFIGGWWWPEIIPVFIAYLAGQWLAEWDERARKKIEREARALSVQPPPWRQ